MSGESARSTSSDVPLPRKHDDEPPARPRAARERAFPAAEDSALVIVADAVGDRLEQAVVSLHVMHAADGMPVEPTERRTGPDGTLRTDASLDVPHAAFAVWASHPEHTARGRMAGVDDVPLTLELPSDPGLRVRVIDPRGVAVSAAEVHEVGLTHDAALALRRNSLPTSRSGLELDRLPTFRRDFVTDDDGRVEAHPCDFPVVVRAHAGKRSSLPVVVEPGTSEVELVLAEETSALGTVRFPAAFARADEVRIDAFARARGAVDDSGIVALGTASVRADGKWGPLELALDDELELVVRLRGGGLVPIERLVDPRASSPPFVVDFEPTVGLSLDVFVFEASEGEPRGIAHAIVDFRWLDDANQRIRRSASWTDAHGRARIEGCPETTGAVRASAVGYTSRRVGTVGLPRLLPLDIELEAGGTVEGRCLFAGRPVTSFDVLVWASDPAQRSVHVFRDRADGSFRVEGAPFGAVQILAVPVDLPESDVQRIEVVPDRVAHVEIELPEPVVGRGRVVDAETREPIARARVVPWVTASSAVLEERGTSFDVEGDGSFEVEDFPPRHAVIFVEAEGYARERASGSYRPGEGIEFGEIALSRAGELLVRVLADGPFDASVLWIQSDGNNPIPYHQMPPSGELRIEGVQPGMHAVNAVWQDGAYLCRHVELVPGRPWVVEFEIPTKAELTVEIVAEGGLDALPETELLTTLRDARGQTTIRGDFVPADGRVVLRACDARELWLELVAAGGGLLAFEHVRLAPDQPRHVKLRVTSRALRVLVVDRDENPLPGVQVELATLDEDQPLSTFQRSDANGRTEFRGVSADAVLLSAGGSDLGREVREVALAPEGATEVKFVLDGGHDLRLRMLDGDERVPGVNAVLHGPTRAIYVARLRADADGIASWPRMSASRYHLRVEHAGVWPIWHGFEFTGDPEPIEVQVRRVGNLALRFVDADGLALRDIQVDLSSMEFHESVANWASEHRIVVEPASLRTDDRGEVSVKGVPNGAYLLRVEAPTGITLQHTVVVPPADTLRRVFVLE